MNLELTETEAQAVINSQRAKLGVLQGRLTRAHVCWHYVNSQKAYITPEQVEKAIKYLTHQLEQCYCHERDLDEDEITDLIKQYKDLREQRFPLWHEKRGAEVPIMGMLYQLVINDMDAKKASYNVHHFEEMPKYLWKEGEPVAPKHFSSNGVMP